MIPNELIRIWEKHDGRYIEHSQNTDPSTTDVFIIDAEGFEKFCTELAEQAARMGVKLTQKLFNHSVAQALKEQENTDGA